MSNDITEPKITRRDSGEWVLIGPDSDKEKFIKQALKKCETLSEKVYLLRGVVNLDTGEACRLLNISPHTVENVVWRLRKKGLKIPDKRRLTTAEKLRVRMRKILSSVALEKVDFV